MFTTTNKTASLEVTDPNAVKPARKTRGLKQLLKQLHPGNAATEGEEVCLRKLIGSGNYTYAGLDRWLVPLEANLGTLYYRRRACALCASGSHDPAGGCSQPAAPSEENVLTAKNSRASTPKRRAFMQFAIWGQPVPAGAIPAVAS